MADLTARILDRLEESEIGATIGDLTALLGAPLGDVRAALYDLALSKRVTFSNGMWLASRRPRRAAL
jgi:hypothetical protein